MTPYKQNFKVYQGGTFSEIIRWESDIKNYKTISAIDKSAPVRLTVTAHGIISGWRGWITNVKGMTEINSEDTPVILTVVDPNTIIVNSINAVDYTAYSSGGILRINDPMPLIGYTARMQLRAKVSDSTVLYELTTENGGIIINDSTKTITITIPASVTAGFTFKSAVYSLELVSGLTVYPILTGSISVEPEVTR